MASASYAAVAADTKRSNKSRASAHYELGMLAEAAGDVRAVLGFSPLTHRSDETRLHALIRSAASPHSLFMHAQVKSAISELKKAAGLDPERSDAQFNLGARG